MRYLVFGMMMLLLLNTAAQTEPAGISPMDQLGSLAQPSTPIMHDDNFQSPELLSMAFMQTTDSIKLLKINHAITLINQQEFKKAMKYLKKEIKNDPKFYEAYFVSGIIYRETGEMDEAIDFFASGIPYSQNPGLDHFVLGNCYFMVEKYRPAFYNYLEAIRFDPMLTGAYNNLALIRVLEQGHGPTHDRDLKMAMKDFNKMMMNDTIPHEVANMNMGIINLSLGNYDEAVTRFEESLKANSNFKKSLFFLSVIRFYRKDYDTALEGFTELKNSGYKIEQCKAFIEQININLDHRSGN